MGLDRISLLIPEVFSAPVDAAAVLGAHEAYSVSSLLGVNIASALVGIGITDSSQFNETLRLVSAADNLLSYTNNTVGSSSSSSSSVVPYVADDLNAMVGNAST